MSSFSILVGLVMAGLLTLTGIALFNVYIKNPFHYPYICISLDVSGRQLPDIYDELDRFINQHGADYIDDQYNSLMQWQYDSEKQISHMSFKTHRMKQLYKVIDPACFHIQMIKRQSGKQSAAVSDSNIKLVLDKIDLSYEEIDRRAMKLESINYSCTLSEYANSVKSSTRAFTALS